MRSARYLLLAAISALVLVEGCGPAELENEKAPPESGSPAATPAPHALAPASPHAATQATPTPASPHAPTPASPHAPTPGVPPPPAPSAPRDEKVLLAGAESLGKALLEALRAGDRERARGLVFSSKDFEKAVMPGHRVIIESTIAAQNDLVLEKLAEALKGREAKAAWRPGALVQGAKGVFQKAIPILSNAALDLDIDGAPITIQLDQMVHLDEGWKIFRLSLP